MELTEPPNKEGFLQVGELYELHAGEVHAAIRRIIRQADASEDILQEVFIRAWNHRNDLPNIKNPRNWLIRIGTNLSLNALRGENRKKELLIGDGDSDPSEPQHYAIQKALTDFATPGPESELIRNSRIEAVRHMISDLPSDKREVLELIDQDDFSIREASERLGIPDGTVKSRLFYGRRILSERIRDLLDE